MKQLETYIKLFSQKLIKEGLERNNIYIRFGKIPKLEQSSIGLDDEMRAEMGNATHESGVSVYKASMRPNGKGYNLLDTNSEKAKYDIGGNYISDMFEEIFKDAIAYGDIFLVTGTKLKQTGSDGEPLLRNVSVIKRLKLSDIFLDDRSDVPASEIFSKTHDENLLKNEEIASAMESGKLEKWGFFKNENDEIKFVTDLKRMTKSYYDIFDKKIIHN